jgi:hypothetical protein
VAAAPCATGSCPPHGVQLPGHESLAAGLDQFEADGDDIGEAAARQQSLHASRGRAQGYQAIRTHLGATTLAYELGEAGFAEAWDAISQWRKLWRDVASYIVTDDRRNRSVRTCHVPW